MKIKSLTKTVNLYQAVNEISMALVKIKDVDKVFYSITKAARELVSAERATLFLANAKDHVLWSKVAEGASGRIEVPFGKGLVGE